MQLLGESVDPLPRRDLATTWPDDPAKVERCLAALVDDGLVEPVEGGYTLPR